MTRLNDAHDGCNQAAEAQWRQHFFAHEQGPMTAAPDGPSGAPLDALFDTVRRRRLILPAPPRAWPSLKAGGASRLRIAEHVLNQVPTARAQEQLDLLDSMPLEVDQARAILAAGCPLVDRGLVGAIFTSTAPRDALYQALGLARAKVLGLQVATLSPQRLPFADYRRFFAQLEARARNPTWGLGESEQVVLIKIAVLASTQAEHQGSLPALLEWSDRIGYQLGTAAWWAIFQPGQVQAGHRLATLLHAAELTAEVSQDVPVHSALRGLQGRTLDLNQFLEELERERSQLFASGHRARDLESVAHDFRTMTEKGGVSMGAARLEAAVQGCREVLTAWAGLRGLSATALAGELARLRAQGLAAGGALVGTPQAQLLAVGCESIRRHFKITPYSTQIVTVLGLLLKAPTDRGQLAQVKTGEGKSTIVTLLALYSAALRHKVDIISSARPLAIRDQHKYAGLLRSWGLSSAHICRDRQHDDEFLCDVLYGTNTDFEFSHLYEALGLGRPEHSLGPTERALRPTDRVIVDEVDNLFIDQGRSSAIISTVRHDPNVWVVTPILGLVRDWQENGVPRDPIRATRQALSIGRRGAEQVALGALSDESLQRWLHNATLALTEKKRNEDYVLIDLQARAGLSEHDQDRPVATGQVDTKLSVVILDRSTGQLLLRSRWHDRLHQFIEAKHGLSIHDETLTTAEMSHPVFFTQYRDIFGVTGTLGDAAERQEVFDTYAVPTFDTPPYQTSKRQILEPMLCPDEDSFLAALTDGVTRMQALGRPCLVLLASIKETQKFSQHLHAKTIGHQVLNAMQQEDEALVVARAGHAGMVTVATNMAGRGTDVILTPASRAAGGLHVLMGFYADNVRIEEQGMGRAARQGQPGSAQRIIHTETMQPLLEPGEALNSMDDLAALRTRLLCGEVKSRAGKVVVDRIIQQHAVRFYEGLKQWDASMSETLLHEETTKLQQRLWPTVDNDLASDALRPGASTSDQPAGVDQNEALVAHLRALRDTPCLDIQHSVVLSRIWIAAFVQAAREQHVLIWGDTLVALKRAGEIYCAAPCATNRSTFADQAKWIFATKMAAAQLWLERPQETFRAQVAGLLERAGVGQSAALPPRSRP